MLELIAESIAYIFPAYCANAIPVILGGGKPLDMGKNFLDQKRIFGAHKTFRGFFAGLLVGTLVGIGESAVLLNYNALLGPMLSIGALVGDLIGAFVKRRLNLAPGDFMPVLDQLDFVFFALIFSLPVSPPSLTMALLIILLTIPIHLMTNLFAFLLHIKEKPW